MMPPVIVNKIFFEEEEFSLLSKIGIEIDIYHINLKKLHSHIIKYISRRYKNYKVLI